MTFFSAHLKPAAEPVLVPERFAFWAFIFGPLWLLAHRAWIAAALSLAAYALIGALAPDPASKIMGFGLAVLLGLLGHDLRRWSLARRGYQEVHVLVARGPEEALLRLISHRPDVAERYRPAPA